MTTRTDLPSIREPEKPPLMSATHEWPEVRLRRVETFPATAAQPIYVGAYAYRHRKVGGTDDRFISIGLAGYPNNGNDMLDVGANLFSVTDEGDIDLVDSIVLFDNYASGQGGGLSTIHIDNVGNAGTDWVVTTTGPNVYGEFRVRRVSVIGDALVAGPVASIPYFGNNGKDPVVAGHPTDRGQAAWSYIYDTSSFGENGERVKWYTINLDAGTATFRTDLWKATLFPGSVSGDRLFGHDMVQMGDHVLMWMTRVGLGTGQAKFFRMSFEGSILATHHIQDYPGSGGGFSHSMLQNLTPTLAYMALQQHANDSLGNASQPYDAYITPTTFDVQYYPLDYTEEPPRPYQHAAAYDDDTFTRELYEYNYQTNTPTQGLGIFPTSDPRNRTQLLLWPLNGTPLYTNRVTDAVYAGFEYSFTTTHAYDGITTMVVDGLRGKSTSTREGVGFHRLT